MACCDSNSGVLVAGNRIRWVWEDNKLTIFTVDMPKSFHQREEIRGKYYKGKSVGEA